MMGTSKAELGVTKALYDGLGAIAWRAGAM